MYDVVEHHNTVWVYVSGYDAGPGCGPHGQIFGTEKQCRKYWVAWDPANRPAIFSKLFGKAVETDNYELTNFKTTFDLVNILREKQDRT